MDNKKITDLGNSHMFEVINKIKNDLDEKELVIIKTFLSLKFPEALKHLGFDHVKKVEFLPSPYQELKTILMKHIHLLNRDDMMHLNEIAEFYWEDDNAFQVLHSIISKIKRNTSSPEEIDYELRRGIWEDITTIKGCKSEQQKDVGLKSLDDLSDIYEQHPQHREYITTELKRLPEQIKFLAPEYCGSQGENSAMELSQFKMIVRGIKLN